jgi:U3 small nucleolar RNA-associated protein 20
MKNKSMKHKNENAFTVLFEQKKTFSTKKLIFKFYLQFKSFSERITEIDIRKNALYYLEHANESTSDEQTYFFQAVTKWNTLNLSTEFVQFQKKVRGIITLPQLLHRKEEITTWLLEYLDQSTPAALQPILE